MAVTHTWSVNDQLQTRTQDGLSEVIFSLVWQLNSEETVGTGDDAVTYSISSANQISLNTDNLDPATFTSFADLTEAQVVGWAKETIDANAAEGEETADEAKARIETNRKGKVTAQVARKTAEASGMPWAAE